MDPFLREPSGTVLEQAVWDSMSGLDVLHAHIAGTLPPPPLHHLLGITPVTAEEGAATTVPAATAFAQIDLKVNYLRPVAPDGSLLHARATVVHRGRSLAVATAELTDESGRRVALATGSAQILPGRAASLADTAG